MTNQIITPVFMDPSGKWLSWKAKIDFKTCDKCRKKNGKIYDIGIPIDQKPPLHFYCRCIISILQAIMAGTATDNTAFKQTAKQLCNQNIRSCIWME